MNQDVLTGAVVRLRAPEPEDIGRLYEWENDPALWEAGHTLAPYSRHQLEEFVLNAGHDVYRERQVRFMIDLLNPASPSGTVGTIDLFDLDPLHRRAGVGIMVTGPYRGKGVAADALDILIRYARQVLNLRQLYCNISPGNVASIRVFEQKGYVRCGVKKEWTLSGGTWKDEWMYQLILGA